ncbi:hypothetical protein D9M72_509060 [compost metagenome]
MRKRQPACLCEEPSDLFRIAAAGIKGVKAGIVTDDSSSNAAPFERRFQHIVSDPEARDLGNPLHAADDLEQAVGMAHREVAGAQFGEFGAAAEIVTRRGIAHHDVRAAIDEFAGHTVVFNRRSALVLDQKAPTGDRDADPVLVAGKQGGRHIGDPRGGLGLAVHGEEGRALGL